MPEYQALLTLVTMKMLAQIAARNILWRLLSEED